MLNHLLRVIPKNHLSAFVGNLVHTRLPESLAKASVQWFANRYSINMQEAEHPISYYRTIGELFTRNLKSGVRPIQNGVVHPVDGRITAWGEIKAGTLIQAKGRSYQLHEFLDSPEQANKFEGGVYFTYYLCPTDYHHVHSPVGGEVVETRAIPGQLWPVNDWSVSHIEDLFSRNERIVSYIRTDSATIGLVMVGATNVGKMTVTYDKDIVTNSCNKKLSRTYDPGRKIKKGEKIGTFHMGSTVVMLYPPDYLSLAKEDPSGPVKLGETLGEAKGASDAK